MAYLTSTKDVGGINLQEHGLTMIRQTIELLFEEERGEMLMLDGLFNALWNLAQGFQVSPEEIAKIVFETQERKKFRKGVIVARLMELLRHLREGKPLPSVIDELPVI